MRRLIRVLERNGLVRPPETLAHTPQSELTAPRITLSRLPATDGVFLGRSDQLTALNEAWDSSDFSIVSVVGFAGAGKSALIRHWADTISQRFSGSSLFAWSFYTQGTGSHGASSDEFIHAGLEWFGTIVPPNRSPWDKGRQLASLIAADRNLVILDGIERMQARPDFGESRIEDPALRALVRELGTHNKGLLIITSRLPVKDASIASSARHMSIELGSLPVDIGASLLQRLGANGEIERLSQISSSVGGHPLSLNLIGTYIRHVYDGDSRRIAPDLHLPTDIKRRADRLLSWYEGWLSGSPELSVMFALALFDRPATYDLIAVVTQPPTITALSTHRHLRRWSWPFSRRQSMGEEEWTMMVARLRSFRLLLSPKDDPRTIDSHPVVRDYFARQFRKRHPRDWRRAHGRLFAHFLRVSHRDPSSVSELETLFRALRHGCEAGRKQEAYRVYRKRVRILSEHLGVFGSDLTALAGFFEKPYEKPDNNLDPFARALVLADAGSDLIALGRLGEAMEPMQASYRASQALSDLLGMSTDLANLSHLYRIMGNLTESEKRARWAIAMAEEAEFGFRSGVLRERIDGLEALGTTLFAIGRGTESLKTYEIARDLKAGFAGGFGGMGAYHYCDLLISLGRKDEALSIHDDWQTTIDGTESAVSRGLRKLTGIRIMANRIINGGEEGSMRSALDDAVDEVRASGRNDYLPEALLQRAAALIALGEYRLARSGLEEAKGLAEEGGMRLYFVESLRLEVDLERHGGDAAARVEISERFRCAAASIGYARHGIVQ